MRKSRHFLIGSLSVTTLIVVSLSFIPFSTIKISKSLAGDTATSRE
jgi:hypothetical protein